MIEEEPMEVRLIELMELEETRRKTLQKLKIHQALMKKTCDMKAIPKVFNERDLVLKWDELKSRPRKHTKFDAMWSGPFMITKCKPHNACKLPNLEGEELPIPVNGIHLKLCY